MRELITQMAVLFIVWSLAVELTGWALEAWLGDGWWRKILGDQRREEPQQQPVPVPSRAD